MYKLQELIRPIHQAFISFCQHLAHLGFLQILQPIITQQGALQLQQYLLSLQHTAAAGIMQLHVLLGDFFNMSTQLM